MENYPVVELVHLPAALGEMASKEEQTAADDLTQQGVPRDILNGRYRADDGIRPMAVQGRRLLRFGSIFEGRLAVCIDVSSGEVVAVTLKNATVHFVNSSVQRFVETTQAITSRFPFYDESDTEEAYEKAAKDVWDLANGVEDQTRDRFGFWRTLIDDIGMGDFCTERIVSKKR